MKLVTLKLTGYRQYLEPTVLHFPEGLCGICGPNGVGKSKLIEAIGYALYGPAQAVLPKGDKLADIPSRGRQQGSKLVTRVELILEVHGQRYEIVRSQQETMIRLQGSVDALAVGAKPVTMKVIELLHLTPDAYHGTFVARQKEVAGLQTLEPQERKRLVNRLIGIEQVEHALTLADAERKAKNNRLEIAQGSLGKSSAEALLARDALVRLCEAARRECEASAAAAREAQHHYDEAFAAVAAIDQRANMLAEQRRTFGLLQSNRAALESNHKRALRRLDEVTAAQQALATAEAVLEQTTDALAYVEQWDRLEAIDQARLRQAELQRDLAERLTPRQCEREDLQHALAYDDVALKVLREELATQEQEQARVAQQRQQACELRERAEQRLAAARQLGRDGACDMCGQVLGDRLEDVLAHYGQERDSARQDETQATQKVAALGETAAALKRRIEDREHVRSEHQENLYSYDEIPGEMATVQRQIEELATQLSTFSPDELALSYDADAHNTQRATADQRALAEADIVRLQPICTAAPEIRQDVDELARQLQALDAKHQQLEEALMDETSLAESLALAKECLSDATASRDSLLEQAREASTHFARVEAQLEVAEEAMKQALTRESAVQEAEQALLVAERTHSLLNQLLVEITEEARPRLAELLDGWVRALLGPRFR
ncbi:MAG: AAA family ATPase, partial [Ktedonobacterales bacterium]